jgi:hypothetical protein
MKASDVVYDFRKLHKKLKIKVIMHIVVGPCMKGHFIHAGSPLDPELLLLLFFFF